MRELGWRALNNPLTPIVGGLHILRDRVRGDRLAEQLVGAAMKSATRIHDIVRDMGRITGLPLLEWAPPGVPMLDLKRSAPETPLASDSKADRRAERSDGPPAGVS